MSSHSGEPFTVAIDYYSDKTVRFATAYRYETADFVKHGPR